jgi:hypothetical protein
MELIRILTQIEENFQKIFFFIDLIKSNFKENMKFIYQHFYNYLPQFMGNSLKGVAIIFELDVDQIKKAYEIGVETGYFYQFGIFAYIMTAIINRTEISKIKEHLLRISNILQYISLEIIEKMLNEMKTLKLHKIQKEFLMLTQFHSEKVLEKIPELKVGQETKD